MQNLVPRCRNALFNQSTTPAISSSFVAYFRSTPTSFEKWKSKWNNSSGVGGPKPPSRTYVKYKTRQKRADAKKALNDLLFRNGPSKFTLEGDLLKGRKTRKWDADPSDQTDNPKKREPPKSSAHRGGKSHQKRNKSKTKRDNFFDDYDDDPGMQFQAKFGNRSYFWSFKSWEESFSQSSTAGFEWREDSNGTNSRNKWRTISDEESSGDDDESYAIGSHSDRTILGLPISGPLKIDEVKNAFRLAALKWHPDKHQGPSQAMAEEKFKLCVDAYKSLCNALSRA